MIYENYLEKEELDGSLDFEFERVKEIKKLFLCQKEK